MVSLPFIQDLSHLGSSIQGALRRYYAVEHKLRRQPKLWIEYNNQLEDYLALDQMERVPKLDLRNKISYMVPHQPVIKKSSKSTKLRCVYDFSAKISKLESF